MTKHIKIFLKKVPIIDYLYTLPGRLKYKYFNTFTDTCKELSKKKTSLGLEEWKNLRNSSTKPPIHKASKHGYHLNKVDPDLILAKINSSAFIGSGYGDFNLCIYRTGVIDGKRVFEKVYLSNSKAIKKLLWFYGGVIPTIKEKHNIPKILEIKEGQWLTAVYFEYLETLTPVHKTDLIKYVDLFQNLTNKYEESTYSHLICDFKLDSDYKWGKKKLLKLISQYNISIEHLLKIESFINFKNCNYNVAHGDFSLGNVFKPYIYIDFDKSGYYPMGFDYGKVLSLYHSFDFYYEFENYIKVIKPNLKKIDQAVLSYFAAIFYCRFRDLNETVNVSDDFILELFKETYKEFVKIDYN
jgi:hypothetical protein